MSENVIITLVGFGGAVIGSVLTTFFAPWVKWKTEEKKLKLQKQFEDKARKREQIIKWRDMITQVQEDSELSENTIEELLQSHREFLDLEPHLSQKERNSVYGENRTTTVGSVMQGALISLKNAITRLEKEWGL